MNKARIFFSIIISIVCCSHLGATQTDLSSSPCTIVAELENFLHSEVAQKCLRDGFSKRLRPFATAVYLEEAISQENLTKNQQNALRYFFSLINVQYADNRLVPLSRERMPLLHAIVDELSAKVGITKPLICLSTTLLTDNCASSTCSLDPSVSCLVIGYECLQALSTDAAIKTVLAHEIGHAKDMMIKDKKYLKAFSLYSLISISACLLTCFLKENPAFLAKNKINWLVPLCTSLSAGTLFIAFCNLIMRYISLARGPGLNGEIYADQTALELTADPDAFIKAMTSFGDLIAANTPKFEQDAQLFSNRLNAIKNDTNAKQIELLQKLLDQVISKLKNDPEHPSIADRIAMAEKWKVDHDSTAQVSD